MLAITGLNGESVVLDGPWLEKLRSGTSVARVPVAGYRTTHVTVGSRRRSALSRDREPLLTVVFVLETMVGLVLPAERRSELDRFRRALDDAVVVGR